MLPIITTNLLTIKQYFDITATMNRSHRDATEPNPDYVVGPGRPPLETRFQKGRSGNPRGRPRRAKNTLTLLREALDRRIEVEEDGRRRKCSKHELGLARLADKFAAADPQAAKLILGLMLETERRPPPEPEVPPASDEADKLVIDNFIAGLREP